MGPNRTHTKKTKGRARKEYAVMDLRAANVIWKAPLENDQAEVGKNGVPMFFRGRLNAIYFQKSSISFCSLAAAFFNAWRGSNFLRITSSTASTITFRWPASSMKRLALAEAHPLRKGRITGSFLYFS